MTILIFIIPSLIVILVRQGLSHLYWSGVNFFCINNFIEYIVYTGSIVKERQQERKIIEKILLQKDIGTEIDYFGDVGKDREEGGNNKKKKYEERDLDK